MNQYHKSMKAIVSEKGQVTIPKSCRDRLGLRPGTELDFETHNGRLIAVKRPKQDVFRKWRGRGVLPSQLSVDDYLTKVRG